MLFCQRYLHIAILVPAVAKSKANAQKNENKERKHNNMYSA